MSLNFGVTSIEARCSRSSAISVANPMPKHVAFGHPGWSQRAPDNRDENLNPCAPPATLVSACNACHVTKSIVAAAAAAAAVVDAAHTACALAIALLMPPVSNLLL